ncbi:hypothetical protein [uncultured Allofournierella sp.]|uniref:hypothetical protein n=1 Tax=uncultured Allofournierella sp. TaxID=1940258 RepID=UPI003752E056
MTMRCGSIWTNCTPQSWAQKGQKQINPWTATMWQNDAKTNDAAPKRFLQGGLKTGMPKQKSA